MSIAFTFLTYDFPATLWRGLAAGGVTLCFFKNEGNNMPGDKKRLGADTYLYPMPVTIIGANVDNRANFITIAYCGIIQHRPAMIAFASGKIHYTNSGVKENGTFSVNIPSEDMVEVTDFIGMKSGKVMDKSELFKVFYGKLETAPMIEEASLNLECKLVKMLDFGGTNEIFIGEIIEVYAKEGILTSGLPDIKKLKPIVFSMHDMNYWKVGGHLGKAWSIGGDFHK